MKLMCILPFLYEIYFQSVVSTWISPNKTVDIRESVRKECLYHSSNIKLLSLKKQNRDLGTQ